MAKRRKAEKTPISDAIVDWAEDLGKLLGTAETKAKGWLDQRRAVTAQLAKIRDTASGLLSQLGHQGIPEPAKKGRPVGSKNAKPAAPPAPAKRKGGMSEEGRARVAAAQKARWAKIRAEKIKSGNAAKRKP